VERFIRRVRRAWKLKLKLVGDPRLRAGQTVALVNFATLVDGRWYVEQATHTIDTSGYVTELKLRKAPKAGAKRGVWYEVPTPGSTSGEQAIKIRLDH
jgi:phage protein D